MALATLHEQRHLPSLRALPQNLVGSADTGNGRSRSGRAGQIRCW
jgi:hypothetical protein